MIGTKEEVLALVANLRTAGYSIIPCDVPVQGTKGFYAFKSENGAEEGFELSWHAFGFPVETEIQEVTAQEFLSFLREEAQFPCDDPKTLRVGAGRLLREERKIVVRRLHIRDLKASGLGVDIEALRGALRRAAEVATASA